MTAFQEFSARSPLVLVGAGKMGGALLKGWLDRGLAAKAVIAIDPAPPPESRAFLATAGITTAPAPPSGVKARVILVAVKPQIIPTVLPGLRPLLAPGSLTVSIAAGIPLARLAAGLGASAI